MEILLTVLAGWLVIAFAVALLLGRVLSAADRRERAIVITSAGMPGSTREVAPRMDDAEAHETA